MREYDGLVHKNYKDTLKRGVKSDLCIKAIEEASCNW